LSEEELEIEKMFKELEETVPEPEIEQPPTPEPETEVTETPAPQLTPEQKPEEASETKPEPEHEKEEIKILEIPETKEAKEEKKEETEIGEVEVTEDAPPMKEVYLIYGDKGHGKTSLAFGFEGEIACLSFDRKSAIIKATRFKNDSRIHVFDVVKYMNYYDQKTLTESSAFTYDYVLKVLDYIERKLNVDWIVIDGAEIFHQICEWTMRHRHGIGAFEGFPNLNLWKERRILIRKVHNRCLDIAKKGVIYTTYQTKDEIVVQGELITKKDVPKWIDVLIFETDYVIHVDVNPATGSYVARIVTSKNDEKLPSGRVFDVTNKSLWEAVKS